MIENGKITREEIAAQPAAWTQVLDRCPGMAMDWRHLWHSGAISYFIGCGTSYYLALAAARAYQGITRRPGRALPASELLLFPELAIESGRPARYIFISRSGATSEVVKAAEVRAGWGKSSRVAMTCVPESPLTRQVELVCVFPEAYDHSVVMTRSFSSMLLALIALSYLEAGDAAGLANLEKLPMHGSEVLRNCQSQAAELSRCEFDQYIFLGQGPHFGIAQEAALKMQEMALTPAMALHSLEERHGPKSLVNERSVITLLSSAATLAWEKDMAEELAGLGARIWHWHPAALGVAENEGMGSLPLYVLPSQLMAWERAMARGIDCDHPRALSAVVKVALK